MSYGLYDADLKLYPIPFYNLELMKMSTYYKRKREIVGFAPDFSPHMYTHFIVRQDIYSNQNYPTNYDNIEYGGRAFSGNTYAPLPLDIEIMRPDISLYNRAIPTKILPKYKHAISTMQRAEHIRLSLDGANLWSSYEKQFRRDKTAYGVIIHDYDPGAINEGPEIVQDILSNFTGNRTGRRLGMKFPAQVYDTNELIKWLSIQPMGTYFSLVYHGLVETDLMNEIIITRKNSTAYKQMSVDITKELSDAESIGETIHHIFRNIINLRTQRLVFPLIYDNSVFTDDNWKAVMQLINRYNTHIILESSKYDYFPRIEPFETLYSYSKGAIKQYHINEPLLSIDSIRNIFQFVRENNYDLFKDFYEYRGEEVRNDRRIN